MPHIAKRFFFGAGALLGVLALGLLCINLYLQSSGVQQRIRTAAEKELGAELQIRRTTYTPWGGLYLGGLSLPDPVTPERKSAEARGLRIRISLLPLFWGRFVVREASLIEPVLVIRQGADGNWILPFARRAPKEPGMPDATTPSGKKGPSFRAELQRVRLAGGTILFLDAKNRELLALEKVDGTARLLPDDNGEGAFYVARMEFFQSLKPAKIGGPFTWDGRVLNFPEITGQLAGGTLTGSYRLETGGDPRFALTTRLEGVLLKKLVEDAHIEPGKTEGQLRGTFELAGDPRNSDSLEGSGHLELVAAQLRPMEFLVKLGELFQIDELQLLKLHEATADFTVSDERVRIGGLTLKSENLIISGTGPIRFNGKLNLEARLLVNEKLQRQLRGVLGNQLVESDVPGYRQIPFTVTGRLDSPKTDLLDKIIGVKIGGEVPGILKQLFQAFPTPKKKSGGGGSGKK